MQIRRFENAPNLALGDLWFGKEHSRSEKLKELAVF
jgi:hypothetical protein